jgi:hypothetical protein
MALNGVIAAMKNGRRGKKGKKNKKRQNLKTRLNTYDGKYKKGSKEKRENTRAFLERSWFC